MRSQFHDQYKIQVKPSCVTVVYIATPASEILFVLAGHLMS